MGMAAGERIDEKVPALARPQRLDHQRVAGRHDRPARLQLDQRPRQLHLRRRRSGRPRRPRIRAARRPPFRSTAASCRRPSAARRRWRASPAARRRSSRGPGPVRAGGRRTRRRRPCAGALMKDSSIEPTLRPFIIFTSIDASATMVPIDMRWRWAMRRSSTRNDALGVGHDAAILRVRPQRLAAAADEVEGPRELLVGQVAVAPRAADLRQQLLARENRCRAQA